MFNIATGGCDLTNGLKQPTYIAGLMKEMRFKATTISYYGTILAAVLGP